MDVSIIVTCYNEEVNIAECLISLVCQRYYKGQFEVVVADGGSKDNTQQIVRGFEKGNPDVRLVVETKRGTAAGRNAGVRAARFDHVAFIDADCKAPEDWLAKLVEHYQMISFGDPKVVAVGGSNIPTENSIIFSKAIGVALDSYLGSFNSVQGRMSKEPVYVSSLSNLNVIYRKQVIIDIGYYDESLLSEAEDADINFRLHSAGYRFVFIPDLFVWHKMRPTPWTWMKNMFRYGKGRARLLKRNPRMWNLTFILPLLFALGISATLLTPFNMLFSLSLLYFPGILLFSIFHSFRKQFPKLALHVTYAFLIQHIGYAAGEVYGLLNPNVR